MVGVQEVLTPLCEIGKRCGTDKYHQHRYTPIYWRLLADRAATIERVLEVGIGKGRSLRMWEEFCPAAKIVGVDIDPARLVNRGRIVSHHGDQGRPEQLAAIAREYRPFDVIVDDGNHDAAHQVAAMQALLPFVAPGGFYFIEDVRYLTDQIVMKIPVGFRWEAYEGAKRLVAGLRKGRAEVLMVIRHCSTS